MAKMTDDLDRIQDWEQPPEKGPLSEAEEALMQEAVVALRRVINGCPNLPDHAHSAIRASFSLHKMYVGGSRGLRAVR